MLPTKIHVDHIYSSSTGLQTIGITIIMYPLLSGEFKIVLGAFQNWVQSALDRFIYKVGRVLYTTPVSDDFPATLCRMMQPVPLYSQDEAST